MNLVRSLVFYAAFYGGSVLWVTTAVVVLLTVPGRIGAVARSWSRLHRFCLRHFAGIRIEEEGKRFPGPVLYAFKHESFLEAIDLPARLGNPAIFAKRELFDLPGWGRAAAAYGAIPVDRSGGARTLRAMVSEARAAVRGGRPLVIFPEGTRVPHGTRAPLQAGFAALYKMLGLPVVPVAIDSGPLYQGPVKRPGTVTLRFGEPIEPGLPRAEIEARVIAAINALNPG